MKTARDLIAARAEIECLLDILADVIAQSCSVGGKLDSYALSAYADAMRLLAKHHMLTIEHDVGRRVVGQWIKPRPTAR